MKTAKWLADPSPATKQWVRVNGFPVPLVVVVEEEAHQPHFSASMKVSECHRDRFLQPGRG